MKRKSISRIRSFLWNIALFNGCWTLHL